MDKEEIRQLFIDKKILSESGKRKQCWTKNFDEESRIIFESFSKSYRSDEEAWFCLSHNVEPYHCEICGNLAEFNGTIKNKDHIGYNSVCENCSANATQTHYSKFKESLSNKTKEDKEQAKEKRRQTNLYKYGEENAFLYGSESFKQNMTLKYGTPFFNNIEKRKQTNLENTGYESNFQDPAFREQAMKTKSSIYGEGNSSNYSKAKQTNLSKYGYEHMSQIPEINAKAQASKKARREQAGIDNNCTMRRRLIEQYGQGWLKLNLPQIKIWDCVYISNDDIPKIIEYASKGTKTNNYVSKPEKELANFIKSVYPGTVEENNTSRISNYNYRNFELDIFLPDLNIAFDFDGNYYHSSLLKDKFYHQRKTIACYEQGVQLIHIYEYMWISDKDKIKQKIIDFFKDQNSCLDMNWIPLNEYNNYRLSEPEEIKLKNLVIYNEGKFEKICD